jgi:SPP1 family predicted phage head-tail adaptor
MSGQVPAGSLSKRVRIQRRAATLDALNQPIGEWTTFATVWADIRVITGLSAANSEFIAADQQVSRFTASIRIRARTDIDHSCRVVHNNAIYDVRVVLPDPGGEYVDLVCAIGAREG